MRHIDALVLSSPALALHLSGVQKILMEYLPKLVPDLRIANGVQSRHLSHDAAVVKDYDDDALQHGPHQRQTGRLYAGRR